MAHKRGGLILVAEALADLGGPVQALREDPPPAQRGFTVADQVNQLAAAREADPDRGFLARTMALCSLPRSNPGDRHQYTRANGPYKLIMSTTGIYKLPFGNLPRLILAWLCTEVVRTPKPRDRSREIALRLHAVPGYLQQQRRKIHPAPQPDEAAVWLQRLNDLRRQAR